METTKVYKMKKDYRFRFGKYKAKRVDEVLAKGIYGREFIAWIYANKADLDFSDDILDEIGITERIVKPGVNPAVHAAYLERLSEEERSQLKRVRMGDWQREQRRNRQYRGFVEGVSQLHRDRSEGKAGTLAWKNQGH